MKHIGFSIIDKDGDLHRDQSGEMFVVESKLAAKSLRKYCEYHTPEFSPHKIVRVLIDEIEDDNKI